MESMYPIIELLVKAIIAISVFMLLVAYSTLLERRLLGRMQVRPGPNRVGWFGLLQPIADGIKMFFKEEIVPAEADKILYIMAPGICLFTVLSMFAVIPFGGTIALFGHKIKLVIADINFPAAEKVVRELGKDGVQALALKTDVASVKDRQDRRPSVGACGSP